MENNLREQFLGFYQTPFLFNNTITQLQLFEFDLINIDQINFSKLKIKQKLPLGKRVEQFFQFYLSHSKRYNIIKQNIQIIHNKNTIGEIDFILYDKLKMKTIHLELVYKFYLYDSTFNDGFHGYIGPNRDDTLVKKITKLKKKQLPLLYKDETKEYLDDLEIGTIEQKVAFFAQIFLPYNINKKTLPIINNNTIVGYYMNINEFTKNKFSQYSFNLPHKYDWLSIPNNCNKWILYEQCLNEIQYFLSLKKSPLVWVKKENNIFEKFFITWW